MLLSRFFVIIYKIEQQFLGENCLYSIFFLSIQFEKFILIFRFAKDCI